MELLVEHSLDADPDFIWPLIVDFGNIEAWWPQGQAIDIERVDIDGEGIGMTRHIYNAGFSHAVSEQLLALDPEIYRWQLAIVGERPAGLVQYTATGQLHPSDDGSCGISYRGEFRTEPGREQEAETFLRGAYQMMFDGLQQAADRARASNDAASTQ
ncbi:hypothetical protein NOR51B_950 [Luminiphilus syltensis NOR5-1B]|uniref:Uncharacterized protein n=1 Tax=Luminiphilus syltensis NOR5-1B TaxID=565045 RepID=B8KSP0_9GAMM|nr:SRPBCC family protein [Luminiphilus syltensis]EED35009.1 hypothetical protein NOR51B_950 [Luminiphilus syltensis NOR5-1B]